MGGTTVVLWVVLGGTTVILWLVLWVMGECLRFPADASLGAGGC